MMRRRLTSVLVTAAIGAAGLTTAGVVTATSASADACYTWSRTLKKGMSGADVKVLQVRVAGWVPRGQVMTADGIFGDQTVAAVSNFQKGYGLGADGVAGSGTLNKIYALQDDDCTPVHFSWAEIAADTNCGRGLTGEGTKPWTEIKSNLMRAMWQAEALRHRLGDQPLRVTSSFRDKNCDKSPYGEHTTGRALDLVPAGSTPTLCTIAQGARYAGYGGIFGPGYDAAHETHVHVDFRTSVAWSASKCGI